MNTTTLKLTLAVSLLLQMPALQAEQQSGMELSASAGYRHDSNVSLAELDTNTGEADQATLLEVGIKGNVAVTQQLGLQASYDVSQTSYAEFSDFDTTLHKLQGDINWKVAGFNSALSLRHFAARLDGERFLDIRQVSPSIARLIGNKVYLRGAVTGSEKLYAENPDRDASNTAFDIDAYWLLNGMQQYVALGLRADDEDAEAAEFDYAGNRVKLTIGQSLGEATLKLRAQLERRDYAMFDETMGANRSDERLQAGINLEVPLTDHFSVEGDALYSDIRSNLESVAFDEAVYAINLSATF